MSLPHSPPPQIIINFLRAIEDTQLRKQESGATRKKKHSEKKKVLLKMKVRGTETNTEGGSKDKDVGNGRDEA